MPINDTYFLKRYRSSKPQMKFYKILILVLFLITILFTNIVTFALSEQNAFIAIKATNIADQDVRLQNSNSDPGFRGSPSKGIMDQSWPSFRGNVQNTGTTTSSSIPNNNLTHWIFNANDTIKSSPAVLNDKVYFGTSNGTLICLLQENGTEVWRRGLEPIIYSSPAVESSRVVIGTTTGSIYCLDANNGSILWNITTGTQVESSPTLYNDTIFINSYDGNLYAIDLISGEFLWNYTTSGWMHTTPAIWNDQIIFGGCDGILHSIYISNKTTNCEYITKNYVVSSPAVNTGSIFFGTHSGQIISIDAKTGELRWENASTAGIKSSPAVTNDLVVFATTDGKIITLNSSTGARKWTFNTTGGLEIYSSPAIAQDKLVFGAGDNRVYCLDLNNGLELWNYSTGDMIESSPALAYDRIFIGSDDGNLYCFGTDKEIFIPTAKVISHDQYHEINTTELLLQGTAEVTNGTIDYVEVKLDDGSWVRANGSSNWNIVINFTNLSNGEHDIFFRAFNGITFSNDLFVTIILNIPTKDNNGSSVEDSDSVSINWLFIGISSMIAIWVLIILSILVLGRRKN